MKVVRVQLLLKQARQKAHKLIHSSTGGHAGQDQRYSCQSGGQGSRIGLFAMYVFSTASLTLTMMWTGLDVLSAYSAVAACLNTLGPGLGKGGG